MEYFPSFSDLDLDHMHENTRLLRHATKVIETVTFVVDSIGDETKSNELNEALLGLVKAHLKRKVATPEFKNLGIVLIDFICNVNNRRSIKIAVNKEQGDLNSEQKSINQVDDDPTTMTDALDKLRSPSTISPSLTDPDSISDTGYIRQTSAIRNKSTVPITPDSLSLSRQQTKDNSISCCNNSKQFVEKVSLDTNSLVAAWTRLYGVILGLVEREEKLLEQSQATAFKAT